MVLKFDEPISFLLPPSKCKIFFHINMSWVGWGGNPFPDRIKDTGLDPMIQLHEQKHFYSHAGRRTKLPDIIAAS